MFSGCSELKTSRSLTVHVTTTGNDLSVHPTSTRKTPSFTSQMGAFSWGVINKDG